MQDAFGHFPARLPTPDENALVVEWLAAAGDIANAYVSRRFDDDPACYRRIVVVTKPDAGPSHLVYAPTGGQRWIVFSIGSPARLDIFPTLREALNSIRPVLLSEGIAAEGEMPDP
jgi:hypothetical protein